MARVLQEVKLKPVGLEIDEGIMAGFLLHLAVVYTCISGKKLKMGFLAGVEDRYEILFSFAGGGAIQR